MIQIIALLSFFFLFWPVTTANAGRFIATPFAETLPAGRYSLWQFGLYEGQSTKELKEIISKLGELMPIKNEWGSGPAKNFQLPGAKGVIGFISAISDHFCAGCNRLRLTSDGKLRPCLFSDSEIDLKKAIREGCDDNELQRLLLLGLQIKPEKHNINESDPNAIERPMSAIGG
jgi:cyclic pyranopterin phosphate synthase